jgi:hypothetical protein
MARRKIQTKKSIILSFSDEFSPKHSSKRGSNQLEGGNNMDKVLVGLSLIAVLALGLVFGALAFSKETKVNVPLPVKDVVFVDVPAVYNDSAVSAKLDRLTNEVFKEDNQEVKALELAKAEFDVKSFKKDLFAILEENVSIEEYKDIESISVLKSDVEVSGDSAVVDLTLKVRFDSFGDTENAKVFATFTVDGLVVDDSFEDSEVSDVEFTFVKLY